MDTLEDNLLNLWKKLDQNNVQYIMVGGFASILNGSSLPISNEADIWLKDTLENRKALRKTLMELEIGDFEALETMQFVAEFSTIYLKSFMELNLLTDMKHFLQDDFDTCYGMAKFAEIDDFKIPFLHINQLLQEKKANNRPKDQLDIAELEEIQQLLNTTKD